MPLMKPLGRTVQPLAWVLISVCLIACPVLAQSLEVIDLKFRTAAEVIPVLQPLVEQGGALTGQDYKLFVRASPANLQQLRAALEQIDRKPNQFVIETDVADETGNCIEIVGIADRRRANLGMVQQLRGIGIARDCFGRRANDVRIRVLQEGFETLMLKQLT